MPFWNLNKVPLSPFRAGIQSAAEIGEDLIMVCMEIEAGMEDSGHAHAFDQCGWVVEGRIEMFIGDERRVLNPQEAYFIPSEVQHGWKTLDQPVKLMDVSVKT